MKNIHYNIIFRAEPEGGFTVFVPALPGCITYGKTLAQARKMAKEAIELYLEDIIASGDTVPENNDAYVSTIAITVPSKNLVYA